MINRIRQQLAYLIIALATLLFLSACSQSSGGSAPDSSAKASPSPAKISSSVDVVQASAAEVQISGGGSAEAIVRVAIRSGYHINANPASDSYLKATELTLKPDDGFSVGFISYPSPITKTFSFSKKPLAVFEGEAAIKVLLKAADSASKGHHSLAGKLNVQACDDQVCYAPGTIDLTIPVTVK